MSQTQFLPHATIHLHRNDLPDGVSFGNAVAVDTETMGLDPRRDRLCLVQLSAGDGTAHCVQIIRARWAARGSTARTSPASWRTRMWSS